MRGKEAVVFFVVALALTKTICITCSQERTSLDVAEIFSQFNASPAVSSVYLLWNHLASSRKRFLRKFEFSMCEDNRKFYHYYYIISFWYDGVIKIDWRIPPNAGPQKLFARHRVIAAEISRKKLETRKPTVSLDYDVSNEQDGGKRVRFASVDIEGSASSLLRRCISEGNVFSTLHF